MVNRGRFDPQREKQSIVVDDHNRRKVKIFDYDKAFLAGAYGHRRQGEKFLA